MNIQWHGQSCFDIVTTPAKNSQVKIVIDPFSEETGLRVPKLEADIVLTTHHHPGHDNSRAVGGNPFLIDGPGEYEIKKVCIQGVFSWHDDKGGSEAKALLPPKGGKLKGSNTIYIIEAEDLRLCHLGDLGQQELTEEQLEKIGEIDVLMIPIGGGETISAKEALKIMSQIEPKIIIPMHYQIPERERRVEMKRQLHRLPKLKPSAGGKLEGLDNFLKALGIKSIEGLPKLSVKKKELSSEEAKIIVLKP